MPIPIATDKRDTHAKCTRRIVVIVAVIFTLALYLAFAYAPLEIAATEFVLLATLFALSFSAAVADGVCNSKPGRHTQVFWMITVVVGLAAWIAAVLVLERSGRWWLFGTIPGVMYWGQRAADCWLHAQLP